MEQPAKRPFEAWRIWRTWIEIERTGANYKQMNICQNVGLETGFTSYSLN
jgi:hypothetical protein